MEQKDIEEQFSKTNDMDNKQIEEGHLLTMMGVAFGSKAIDENGNKVAKYNWAEFQQLVRSFYECGKGCKG